MTEAERQLHLVHCFETVARRAAEAATFARNWPSEKVDLLVTGHHVNQLGDALEQLRAQLFNARVQAEARREADVLRGGRP